MTRPGPVRLSGQDSFKCLGVKGRCEPLKKNFNKIICPVYV